MESIRTYEGEIRLCRNCGQPCYYGDVAAAQGVLLWQHFREQWDGIYCRDFPLADANPIAINWDESSRRDVRVQYPDTFPAFV